MANLKGKKKRYTLLNLPFSNGYMKQMSRLQMGIWGCVLGAVFLTYFFFDASFQKNSFISSGELSSGHAVFEKKCESCHDIGHGVVDALCSNCHEKTSVYTVYDFEAHYLYRSNDAQRVSPAARQEYADRELPCSSCHIEHRGKEADLKLVSDRKCVTCHEFGSFNKNHPEFEFARTNRPDDANLLMTHIRHTGFVLSELNGGAPLEAVFQKLKMETMDFRFFFEGACLYCHHPDPDGRNFQNIDFDKHCAQCHLKGDAAVQGLPRRDPPAPDKPGVETIRDMQMRGGPGLAWVYATNPNQTMVEGGEISKSPIYHKDPWIMENLRQIRRTLYPTDGLFDLLESSGEATLQDVDTLYHRAIAALQKHTIELRARVELKGEVSKIRAYLEEAREKLQDPLAPRKLQGFRFPFDSPNPGIAESTRQQFEKLARDLTAEDGPECQKCHLLDHVAIARVRADQKVLVRAEFNHRAHILQLRCMDCHTAIAIDEAKIKMAVESISTFKTAFADAYAADQAATQNLPRIRSCTACHARQQVSDKCTTCHQFHPNKQQRSSLQIWPAVTP